MWLTDKPSPTDEDRLVTKSNSADRDRDRKRRKQRQTEREREEGNDGGNNSRIRRYISRRVYIKSLQIRRERELSRMQKRVEWRGRGRASLSLSLVIRDGKSDGNVDGFENSDCLSPPTFLSSFSPFFPRSLLPHFLRRLNISTMAKPSTTSIFNYYLRTNGWEWGRGGGEGRRIWKSTSFF